MFDIGWTEMMVIIALAIVVIGPKDLPVVMRQLGRWTRRMRSLAREFQSGLEDMAREADTENLQKKIESAAGLDSLKDLEESMKIPDIAEPIAPAKPDLPKAEPEAEPEDTPKAKDPTPAPEDPS